MREIAPRAAVQQFRGVEPHLETGRPQVGSRPPSPAQAPDFVERDVKMALLPAAMEKPPLFVQPSEGSE